MKIEGQVDGVVKWLVFPFVAVASINTHQMDLIRHCFLACIYTCTWPWVWIGSVVSGGIAFLFGLRLQYVMKSTFLLAI